MVGYDESYYYFHDPLKSMGKQKYIEYSKKKVETAYELLEKQSVVITKKSYSEFLIIFALGGKCRFSLIFQAFPAFLFTEDTRHIVAFPSLIRQSKVVKV